MEEFHYLGSGPLCGAQIRYLVKSNQYGWLGCLSFSSSTWRLKPRDEWIGWGEGARHAHLQEVVQNSRFLILPSVEVPNLASQVLSLSVERKSLPIEEKESFKWLESYRASSEAQALCPETQVVSVGDREAVRMIASLGGFLGRKCDGEPGTTTMWRGLHSLALLVRGANAARCLHPLGSSP